MNSSSILVTITGSDQPGITSRLMKTLVKNKCRLADMGQAVTHGLLSLSFLIQVEEGDDSSVLKDLLLEAKKMNMQLDFQIVEEKPFTHPRDKYILSCVSPQGLTAEFLSKAAELLAQHQINIHRIDNMSLQGFKSLDIATTAHHPVNWDKIKTDLMTISNQHMIDVAFMKDNVFRHNKRLIVFDMDSTLIQAEVIDEMAEVMGAGEKVKGITHRAMNGELNFSEALKERVQLLKGLTKDQMKEINEKLPLTPGVEKFIKTVKNLGYKTAIVSGGFKYFAESLRLKLGMDYAFANELEFDGNVVTGKVLGQIVHAEQKAFILELLAQQESIHLDQVVAIGDGANDLPMLAKAGLGIAFHAKEKVKEKAKHQMSHGPMTTILYFLGIPGSHLDETL